MRRSDGAPALLLVVRPRERLVLVVITLDLDDDREFGGFLGAEDRDQVGAQLRRRERHVCDTRFSLRPHAAGTK